MLIIATFVSLNSCSTFYVRCVSIKVFLKLGPKTFLGEQNVELIKSRLLIQEMLKEAVL